MCGSYCAYSNRELGDYVCMNFGDIYIKIIPFFLSIGVKSQDFVDWVKEAEYAQAKDRGSACSVLTREGLNKIL